MLKRNHHRIRDASWTHLVITKYSLRMKYLVSNSVWFCCVTGKLFFQFMYDSHIMVVECDRIRVYVRDERQRDVIFWCLALLEIIHEDWSQTKSCRANIYGQKLLIILIKPLNTSLSEGLSFLGKFWVIGK